VSSITWDLWWGGRSSWSGRESDLDWGLWVSQIFIISDVVNDDLLSNVSVEGLLVGWGWEIGSWGWCTGREISGDQSGGGINASGVASDTIGIINTDWVGSSRAESVTESGSLLNVQEIVDGNPVSVSVGDDLLSGPISFGKNGVKSDFTSSGIQGHSWRMSGSTISLLSGGGLRPGNSLVFGIGGGNEVDVWGDSIIDFEDGGKSSGW